MYEETQVKFNAGIDTALYINNLLKRCGYYSSIGDFVSWHNSLREIDRWISPKVLKKVEHKKDLEDSRKDKEKLLGIYQKKIAKGKKLPAFLVTDIYNYLSNYEVTLRKYIDKHGYQMPEASDPRAAL